MSKFPEMIFVEGGTFDLKYEYGRYQEIFAYQCTLNSFLIGKFVITFFQYDEYCETIGKDKPDDNGWGRGNNPVINVNWHDAIDYCNWLSERTGLQKVYQIDASRIFADWDANGYRLPTEAERVYAAIGGKKNQTNYLFSGSNNLDDVGWDNKNSGGKTHPVGQKSPKELGLYDMSGNVHEWCWDWYYSYPQKEHPRESTSFNGDSPRILRGGSVAYLGIGCRMNIRHNHNSKLISKYVGFRCAQSR